MKILTMRKVTLNPGSQLNAEGEFNQIFDFFKSTEIIADTPYPELKQKAQEFLAGADQMTKNAILNSVYQPAGDLFDFPENLDPYDRFAITFGFQNFYRAVHNVLTEHTPLSLQSNGAKPQYVLTKDAFDYMGHNDLEIEPSKAGYAALFYH
ncbi:hypothetical protein [Mucilaginibacter sp.]|uniref:hypothetical protein n=1 Tax=Mucilaginibacter sp. TaxID=1882438 RepID=UPI0025D9B493|nr:hypothetical protein [Mucilaginibacter sp.]